MLNPSRCVVVSVLAAGGPITSKDEELIQTIFLDKNICRSSRSNHQKIQIINLFSVTPIPSSSFVGYLVGLLPLVCLQFISFYLIPKDKKGEHANLPTVSFGGIRLTCCDGGIMGNVCPINRRLCPFSEYQCFVNIDGKEHYYL